jgi:hypothetical protein
MAQVVVSLETIDLLKAELEPVAGEDVKTLQALLNLFPRPATSARTLRSIRLSCSASRYNHLRSGKRQRSAVVPEK